MGRRRRHERVRARRRRALERAGPRAPRLRLDLQRLPRLAGGAGRRGQPGVDRRRRLRPAEGRVRARRGSCHARAGGQRAGRAHLRAARQHLPPAVVGAADRGGRRRRGAGRLPIAPSSSSTPATSPPGCSTSPSCASRAPSTAPRRPAARRCARRSRRRCRRPAAARGCTGCPTTSSWRTTSSRGTSCRCGSGRERRRDVGGGHRARAGGRAALPPGGRDRGRHVGVAARRRRRGDAATGARRTGRAG